ncbi:MAG TPA: MFS transporter, partial [Methylomirabilota bacterium]|nr:MFS transporter [Methylomirabilota bacterium]
MITWLARLHPFRTRESRRLAVLFAVVYFAQGMWDLPTQTLTLTLKEAGLSAGQVADFTLMGTVPWLLKPLYGLLSDLVPLFGRRRTSYVIVMSGLASAAGLAVATAGHHTYWRLALGVAAMGLGLAFADVMIDALMVERGRALGVTGAFQSVQWASIYAAVVLVGLVGGHLAERRDLHTAFALAAAFPLVTCALTAAFVREARAPADRQAVRRTAAAIREAARDRELWIVAGFVFFVTFSPSFGPAFLYYQTDVLHFSQRFIGGLGAVSGVGYVLGAVVYAPLSRRVPLARLVAWTIGLTAAANLAYLLYRTPAAAVAIDLAYGVA